MGLQVRARIQVIELRQELLEEASQVEALKEQMSEEEENASKVNCAQAFTAESHLLLLGIRSSAFWFYHGL